MPAIWFGVVTFMLTVYVVLDGFDFGAGALHLFLARDDHERRAVLAAIGPLWDGNEVWLVASGGVLAFAFPRAYAAALSGFYLPLIIALWLLVLRGLAIELRSQSENPLWRALWDSAFSGASAAVAVVLGAALGNVLRGFPLDERGTFHSALFGGFAAEGEAAALDGYTVLVGLFALALLAAHASAFLAWKTTGPVESRAVRAAPWLWSATAALGAGTTYATWRVQPELFSRLLARPAAWPILAAMVGAWFWIPLSLRGRRHLPLFLGSCLLIAALLGATAAGMFPVILRSSIDPRFDVDAYNAASGERGMAIGLAWWLPAIALAIAYLAYVLRTFRGKARTEESHY